MSSAVGQATGDGLHRRRGVGVCRGTYRRNSAAGGDGAGRALARPKSGPEHYDAEWYDETASSAMRRWIGDDVAERGDVVVMASRVS